MNKNLSSREKARLSKYYTTKRIDSLIALNSPLCNQYERARDCTSVIRVEAGRTITSYCNSRACNHCNRIRTAKGINAYRELFDRDALTFITLSRPNVDGKRLRAEIQNLKTVLQTCRRALKKSSRVKAVGLIKLEVTYNSDRDDYHPHFHILSTAGEQLIDEWLKRNPKASEKAQDIQPVVDAKVPIELLKYAFKDTAKKGDQYQEIPPEAFDTIMQALKNVRTYQPFGGLRSALANPDEVTDLNSKTVSASDGVYVWNPKHREWISKDGEILKE